MTANQEPQPAPKARLTLRERFFGRRLLGAGLAFVVSMGKFALKKCEHLRIQADDMNERRETLYCMACEAGEMGQPLRYVWLILCEKIVYYQAGWLLWRAKHFLARHYRYQRKDKDLCQL